MPDRAFAAQNNTATTRMRNLIARLSDDDLNHAVGEHWTVSIALAHIAFWDARVLAFLDIIEQTGSITLPSIDIIVNDISLPFWAAIPPRETTRLALLNAEKLDQRLEAFAPDIVAQLAASHPRFVVRALHRNEHMNEIEQALGR